MKSSLLFFLLISFLGLSFSTYADTYEPVVHCYKPSKPLFFATQKYKDRYSQDVEKYQNCLKIFILRQQQAVEMHKNAAENAIKANNDIIR